MEPTFWEVELINGEKIKATITFERLYKLANKNKEMYDKYDEIIHGHGNGGDLDSAYVLYVAYVCANIDAEYMGWEEFMAFLPYDPDRIVGIVNEMVAPKKK